MSDVLHAPHVVEYTYTRSTGPAIGAYLTGLREGKIIGTRGSDGRVLVPAVDYDPLTAADLTERIELAHTGTVTTWFWVEQPKPMQPLDRPFAWALVQLDGADVAFLAAVDAGTPHAIATGARVTARFREGAIGVAGDLYFVLGEQSAGSSSAEPGETITMIESPVKLHYEYTPGVAASRFLHAMKDHKIIGQRCPKCTKVYFPSRGACGMCGVATVEEVELSGKGTVASFAVTMVPGKDLPAPYVTAWILLDGSDITSMFLVREVEHTEVRLGMRVEAVWVPDDQLETNLGNITHFKPLDEPDADYDSYREYV